MSTLPKASCLICDHPKDSWYGDNGVRGHLEEIHSLNDKQATDIITTWIHRLRKPIWNHES